MLLTRSRMLSNRVRLRFNVKSNGRDKYILALLHRLNRLQYRNQEESSLWAASSSWTIQGTCATVHRLSA